MIREDPTPFQKTKTSAHDCASVQAFPIRGRLEWVVDEIFRSRGSRQKLYENPLNTAEKSVVDRIAVWLRIFYADRLHPGEKRK